MCIYKKALVALFAVAWIALCLSQPAYAFRKLTCKCTVVSVDDEKAEGWECKCFEISGRRMASAKGPGMKVFAPVTGGGVLGGGNNHGQVTNPENGECFDVEYECKECK